MIKFEVYADDTMLLVWIYDNFVIFQEESFDL